MTDDPFKPNIIFTISEIEEENPFKPTVVLGEGGYNSGKTIKPNTTNLPVDSKERDRLIWTNAQRTYRNRNREAYNANMLSLWKKNKDNQTESYKNWLINQSKANAKYRLKKKLEKLESETFNPDKIPKAVKIETNKIWKQKSQAERKKIKKSSWEKQQYAGVFNQIKSKKISDAKALLKGDVKISTEQEPYAEVDYTDLAVGANPTTKANNLNDLNIYYDTVITKTKPVPTGTVLKEKYKLDLAGAREKHRKILSAGDWNLEGGFKKKDKKKGLRPLDDRYEAKGDNKI